MKNIITLLAIFLCLTAFAQTKTFTVGNHHFKIISKTESQEDEKKIEVYRDNEKLMSHKTFSSSADCSSETSELGMYELNSKNQLVFYTFWCSADRMSSPILPFGAMKQTYQIQKDGKVVPIESIIYKEDFADHQNAIQFLNKGQKTEQEKAEIKAYVDEIERTYNAKFVLGKEKEKLLKETRLKLANEINAETKDWKEWYGNNIKK